MLWFLSGNERMRWPVALKNALSTAGAATATVSSPTPPQNPPDGMMIVSTLGRQGAWDALPSACAEIRARLAECLGELVDEAFEIDRVVIDVHATPEAGL